MAASTSFNPSAFPVRPQYDENGQEIDPGQEGMTLRDYFAGQYLIGKELPAHRQGADVIAKRAYELADAMLKARVSAAP